MSAAKTGDLTSDLLHDFEKIVGRENVIAGDERLLVYECDAYTLEKRSPGVVVLPDGEVVWLGTRPDGGEAVPGYDLRGVVIGSEGMFGIVTRVLLRLIAAPQAFKTMLGVFESVEDASQTVSDIIAAGIVPGALEMMDQLITQAVEAAYHFGFPLDAGAVLIVELDGLAAGLDKQAERVIETRKQNHAREVRTAKTE